MNNQLSEDQLAELKKCFDLFDVDNSGNINMKELKRIAKKLRIQMNDSEAYELMNLMDKNQNGSIDFDEFVVLMSEKFKQDLSRDDISFSFDRYDTDKNGYITDKELNEIILQFKGFNFESNFKKVMELFDRNKDNKIDRKEFIDSVMELIESEKNSTMSQIPEEP